MNTTFQFSLAGLNIQSRQSTYKINVPPMQFNIEPQFDFTKNPDFGALEHRMEALDLYPTIDPLSPTTPHYKPLTDIEIASSISHWYKNSAFRLHAEHRERQNPYRHLDMNVGWTRTRVKNEIFAKESKRQYPLRKGGVEVKFNVWESFKGFSFTRQKESIQFEEGDLEGLGFKMVFKGEEKGGRACYMRSPGQWWGKRRKVLECCKGVRFLEDMEREERELWLRVGCWIGAGMGGACVVDSYGLVTLRKDVRWFQIQSGYCAAIPPIQQRCDKRCSMGWFKWRSGAGLDGKGMAVKRSSGSRGMVQDLKRYKRQKVRRCEKSEQVMSEAWRARRREQEKKAGRWTDGTMLMDRMWEEFYWVSDFDDPLDGPFRPPWTTGC
ncbi:hypothetical protein EG329_014415 [Mollisiaceae sp. DMI_Dod_QoI]|nr:hypothetical protein EG329_014415 [Helotiales sp. DMI_Dod_QoI]